MDLVEALAADGLVCVVGAGGKKSTLWALADRVERAVVTATVRIPIFDPHVADVVVTDDPLPRLQAAADDPSRFPLGLVPEREEGRERYLGYDPETVEAIAKAGVADATLVKADGARMREFKAPSDREPRIPGATDTVLPIASAHVVGEPLSEELVHRPERVAALTGLELGDRIRAEDVATALTHPEGGLKGVPDAATAVPVINKVDDEDDEETAREIGRHVLEHERIDRMALTRMVADDPLVAVL